MTVILEEMGRRGGHEDGGWRSALSHFVILRWRDDFQGLDDGPRYRAQRLFQARYLSQTCLACFTSPSPSSAFRMPMGSASPSSHSLRPACIYEAPKLQWVALFDALRRNQKYGKFAITSLMHLLHATPTMPQPQRYRSCFRVSLPSPGYQQRLKTPPKAIQPS